MPTYETIIRALVGFLLLFICIRIIGKKQLSELSFFIYITGIALGNIAGDMIVHKDITVKDAIVGISFWSALTFLIGYLSLKFPKARLLFIGEPSIVIKDGKIKNNVLKQHRINMDDLAMLLRNRNIFSFKDVDYAILEPNGQLSVLKKYEKELLLREDLNIKNKLRKYIPTEIIVDGNLIERNLTELNLDNKWVGQQLIQLGIGSLKEVFYGQIQEDGSLYIIKKE